MVDTLRLNRSTLIRTAFIALLLVAFAFLAAVIVGGAAPSLGAAAPALGVAAALVVVSHWLYLPPNRPVRSNETKRLVGG